MIYILRFLQRSSLLYNLYAFVLFSLFLLSVIVEKGQDVIFINGNHSTFTDYFFSFVTNLGDGVIFVVIIFATLFIRFGYALICGVAWILHGIFVSIFKRIIFPALPRPKNVLDNDVLHFIPGVKVFGQNSFPSGHTATAFCAAILIGYISKSPKWTVITLILALMVGYSRIYLLQHFLVDVAAGAIIGCFTAYFVWRVYESNQTPDWTNKKLRLSFNRIKSFRLR